MMNDKVVPFGLCAIIGCTLSFVFHWPSIVTFIWALTRIQDCKSKFFVVELFFFELVMRLARFVTVLIHELAHLISAVGLVLVGAAGSSQHPNTMMGRLSFARQFLLGCSLNLSPFGQEDLHENQHVSAFHPSQCILQFIPGALSAGLNLQLPISTPTESCCNFEQPTLSKFVQLAGCLTSVILPFLLWPSFDIPQKSWLSCAIFMGSATTAAGALLSDGLCHLQNKILPPGCFCCGNWGLLVPRIALGTNRSQSQLFPAVVRELLQQILDVVELRGAQAGGCNIFLSSGGCSSSDKVIAVRSRVVKSKRGQLGRQLFYKLNRELFLRWTRHLLFFKPLRPLPVVLAQGHSRFGTSSAPAEVETHPHCWLGPHKDNVWLKDHQTGFWSQQNDVEVCVSITHNGDFDGWKIYEDTVPDGLLGTWLHKVLHHNNPAAGDSPKLAGMMDLLITQGRWAASLRLAFVMRILKHADEVCGWESLESSSVNTMPSTKFFKTLAAILDEVFADCVSSTSDLEPTRKIMDDLARQGTQAILSSESSEVMDVLQNYSLMDIEILTRFCWATCDYFFHNDLLTATWLFFRKAEGSFGISVTCSLWPDRIVLAVKGQPISLAFDPSTPIAFWASEPASLSNTRWPGIPKGSNNISRFDMLDATGEAVELRIVQGSTTQEHLELLRRHCAFLSKLNYVPYISLPGAQASEELPFHLLFRGMSLDKDKPIPILQPVLKARWVKLNFNTAKHSEDLDMLKNAEVPKSRDVVEADLKEVPQVLAAIEHSWSDENSLNCVTAHNFQKCLSFLVTRKKEDYNCDNRKAIDVLVYGVENSLWLGQQFAADLTRIFPRLNIVAMSSNWVLGMLQKDQGHVLATNWALSERTFKMSPHGITLAISQSGTTYPTVWASRLLARQDGVVHMFAMSGLFDTVLASSISTNPLRSTFDGRRFSTHSGIRPSEPSTLATIAMHHTLTKLILHCSEAVVMKQHLNIPTLGSTQNSLHSLPNCELSLPDILDLKSLCESFVASSEALCGATREGLLMKSDALKQVQAAGQYLGSYLTETYYSTIIGALYIYISVTVGYPVLTACWTFIARDLQSKGFSDFAEGSTVHTALSYVVHHLDSWIYVFLAALLISAHRFLKGRRLWTRYTARTVVIVDSTVNYKLLRAYVSKLRALTFRFTTFGVAGQNGLDHFVHEMTHLTQSEVVLLVGRQDGRLASLASAEACTMMSTQQARYIASRSCQGVEALSLGHNPWGGKPGLFRHAVTLPTQHRPLFLSQQLLGTQEGSHPPRDVVQRFEACAHKGEVLPSARLFPWIEKDDLLQRMGGRKEVLPEEARGIIDSLLKEQSEKLFISAAHVDASIVLPPTTVSGSMSPYTPHSPMRRRISFTSSPIMSGPASARTSWLMLLPGGANTTKPGTISLARLMAVLRGPDMQNYVRKLRAKRMKRGMKGVVFAAWKQLTEIRDSTHQTGGSTDLIEELKDKMLRSREVAVPGDWRSHEIKRVMKSRWLFISLFGISQRMVFMTWQIYYRSRSALRGKVCMMLSEDKIIGSCYAGDAKFSAKARLIEHLYETRIAAAERLLAFFVLFHEAVYPLSRLPGLSFDIDRTESRLRVASTPAPVPFVEALPPSPPFVTAMQKIEGAVSRFLYEKRNASAKQEDTSDSTGTADFIHPDLLKDGLQLEEDQSYPDNDSMASL